MKPTISCPSLRTHLRNRHLSYNFNDMLELQLGTETASTHKRWFSVLPETKLLPSTENKVEQSIRVTTVMLLQTADTSSTLSSVHFQNSVCIGYIFLKLVVKKTTKQAYEVLTPKLTNALWERSRNFRSLKVFREFHKWVIFSWCFPERNKDWTSPTAEQKGRQGGGMGRNTPNLSIFIRKAGSIFFWYLTWFFGFAPF